MSWKLTIRYDVTWSVRVLREARKLGPPVRRWFTKVYVPVHAPSQAWLAGTILLFPFPTNYPGPRSARDISVDALNTGLEIWQALMKTAVKLSPGSDFQRLFNFYTNFRCLTRPLCRESPLRKMELNRAALLMLLAVTIQAAAAATFTQNYLAATDAFHTRVLNAGERVDLVLDQTSGTFVKALQIFSRWSF